MSDTGKIYLDGVSKKGERWKIKLPGHAPIFVDKDHHTLDSEKHARWALSQIQDEMARGTFDPDFYSARKKSILSFSVFAEEWLDNYAKLVERQERSVTYLGSLRNYVRNMFIPFFKDRNIKEISGRDIKQFYMSLKYHPKSIWNIMSGLHKLLSDACDEEVIQAIPKFPMEFKASKLPDPQWKWANEEMQDEIFKHLSPDAYFMIYFAATHGTRPGETRALQHQDIDLENNTVTIQRAFSDNCLRPFTKGKRIGILPLDPTWKELYLDRPRHINGEGFVFCDANGKEHGRNWSKNQWNKAQKTAGVAHITLYEGTRHSIASQAGNRGESVQQLNKFLRHSTLEQTKRYTHLEVNALRCIQRKADVKPLFGKASVSRQ